MAATDSGASRSPARINGFKDEAALYDNTFHPYGAIFIMNADGTDKRQLTDSPWEDGMPRFISKPGRP